MGSFCFNGDVYNVSLLSIIAPGLKGIIKDELGNSAMPGLHILMYYYDSIFRFSLTGLVIFIF